MIFIFTQSTHLKIFLYCFFFLCFSFLNYQVLTNEEEIHLKKKKATKGKLG